jgi:hypothetical protein
VSGEAARLRADVLSPAQQQILARIGPVADERCVSMAGGTALASAAEPGVDAPSTDRNTFQAASAGVKLSFTTSRCLRLEPAVLARPPAAGSPRRSTRRR